MVALAQLVQIGKKHRLGQTAVAGQHAVCARAAQRIAGPLQMPNALEQHIITGALINRQIDINFRDRNVAQTLAHIQHVHIACAGVGGLARSIAVNGVAKLFIVAARGLLGGINFLGVHRLHGIVVAFNDRACVTLRHRIADDGVHGHADARSDHQRRKAKL